MATYEGRHSLSSGIASSLLWYTSVVSKGCILKTESIMCTHIHRLSSELYSVYVYMNVTAYTIIIVKMTSVIYLLQLSLVVLYM